MRYLIHDSRAEYFQRRGVLESTESILIIVERLDREILDRAAVIGRVRSSADLDSAVGLPMRVNGVTPLLLNGMMRVFRRMENSGSVAVSGKRWWVLYQSTTFTKPVV